MLKVSIIGNLGQNAETKIIGSASYTVFSVCHSRQRKDAQGNVTQETEWVSCKRRQYNNTDVLLPYLLKGGKVYVTGDLYKREYTDNTGVKRCELNCNVSHIELLAKPQQRDLPSTGGSVPQWQSPAPQDDSPFLY